MTRKNIRPQQVAPVQRETIATASVGEKGMVPLWGEPGLGIQVVADFIRRASF